MEFTRKEVEFFFEFLDNLEEATVHFYEKPNPTPEVDKDELSIRTMDTIRFIKREEWINSPGIVELEFLLTVFKPMYEKAQSGEMELPEEFYSIVSKVIDAFNSFNPIFISFN